MAHTGKKELEVNCDEFVKGKANNWASTVSGKPDSFSEQIKVRLFENWESHCHIDLWIASKQWKKEQVWPFSVVVQLIHRLTQAEISCTSMACLFIF